MKMDLLRRGGLAKMQQWPDGPTFRVKWYRAKPDAALYNKPNLFHHRYYGSVNSENVASDCEGRANAPHSGVGMQFPYDVDPCGCPDWYPFEDNKIPADCDGLAPLGSDKVAREGVTPGVDTLYLTGEGGLLPCCRPIPQFVGAVGTSFVVGPDRPTLVIPDGEVGDLLVAAILADPPLGPIVWPAGWTPYLAGTEPLGPFPYSWGVAWKFATTATESPNVCNVPLQPTIQRGGVVRYRFCNQPFSSAASQQNTARPIFASLNLKPARVSSMLMFAFWNHNVTYGFEPMKDGTQFELLPATLTVSGWYSEGLPPPTSGSRTVLHADINHTPIVRRFAVISISLPSKD